MEPQVWSGSPRRRLYYLGLYRSLLHDPHDAWSMVYRNSMYNEIVYGRSSASCNSTKSTVSCRVPARGPWRTCGRHGLDARCVWARLWHCEYTV